MNLHQTILFNKDECQKIINLVKKNNQYWDSGDRKYKSYTILVNNDTNWIFEKLKNFFEQNTSIKIKTLKKQIHFHIYSEGDYFGVHNDIRDKRVYSVGVLLNDDFNGGEFKIYDKTEIILKKEIGNTYIFDVKLNHEITKITKGNRYSLIWFLQHFHLENNNINKLI